MLQKFFSFSFCITKFLYVRELQENKLCSKKKLLFTTKQITAPQRLAGHLTFRGNYKKAYFNTNYAFRLFFLNFFTEKKKNFSLFDFFLSKDELGFDLNYLLHYWVRPYLSLFRMEIVKLHNKHALWIRYVNPRRRYLLVWKWLSILVRCYKLEYDYFLSSFFMLWQELFLQPQSSNKILKIKLKVYQVYLYKLY